MESIAKFNNKKYYKLKVNESKYLLFKSRDDFEIIEKLDRMVFDLARFALKRKEIILSHMKLIEEYLKTLNLNLYEEEMVEIIDKNYFPYTTEPFPCGQHIDAFDIKFPSLSYFLHTVHFGLPQYPFWILLYRKFETEEMKEKFNDLTRLLIEANIYD